MPSGTTSRARPDGATRPSTCRGSSTWRRGAPTFLEPSSIRCGAWVDFAAGRAASGRHPERAAARPDPLPTSNTSGTRASTSASGSSLAFRPTSASGGPRDDHGPSRPPTCYRSADELARIAASSASAMTRERYGELADERPRRVATEFIVDGGHVRPASQANLVRALAFGLVPEDAAGARRRAISSRSSAPPARTSAPVSSRRRSCCRSSPTTATSTSPTSCSSRTPSRHGW